MPLKEEESLKSTRRGKTNRLKARRERSALADSSTPVDSKPTHKQTTPEENQDSKLPTLQEDNIVTAAAETTKQIETASDSNSDSDTSGIDKRKIHITTGKKKLESTNQEEFPSASNSDSDTSDIIKRKIHITTGKKK